jgi:lipopolysaccharide transport system permease protein
MRSARHDLARSASVAWRFFLRDLRAQHRRSLLGYLWIVLPPAVMSLAWIVLDDAGVIDAGETDVPYGVFVLTGTTLWQGFLDGMNAPFDKLRSSFGLLTKFRLPPEAFVLIGVADVAFAMVVRLLLLALVFVVAGVPVSATALLVPVGVVALILLGTIIGTALAPLGTLFHDVQRGLLLLTTVWFFATPIVYGGSAVSDVQRFNPVAALLVTTRSWLLGGGDSWPGAFLVVLATILVLLPVALLFYRVAVPSLVDRSPG